MSRIFLTTLSLLLLLQLAPSLAAFEQPVNNKLPFGFHSLFPFLGRPEDVNRDVNEPKEEEPVDPQSQPQLGITNPSNLREDFYLKSCPNAEKIITDAFAEIYKQNPGAIGNFLRLQFHDCFVNGCDASILLDYSSSNDEKVEKSSMFNGLLLKGADYVDDIKAKLERACPQTVSCADVLAFTTHEAMIVAGLPRRKPRGGRRDARESLAKNAEANNLPKPDWNMDQMIELFNRKGFSTEEMVILLGAHSVGIAHCDFFMERVYDFKKTGKPDPSLPADVLEELRQACPNPGTAEYRNPPVNFDATPTVLDNLFFKEMVERKKTLLITDSHLLADERTAPIVKKMAADPKLFPSKFPDAMVKLGALNVLTGKQGEIRKVCRSTN